MNPNKRPQKKIGTNEKSITRAENKLDIRYPEIIREKLKKQNGFHWGVYNFFCVFDDEDKFHTFDDVVRENNNTTAGWAKYLPIDYVCIANIDNDCLLINRNKDGKIYSYDHNLDKLSVYTENEEKLSFLLQCQQVAIKKELDKRKKKLLEIKNLFNAPTKQKYFIKLLIHSYTSEDEQVVLLFHNTPKLQDINHGELYYSKVNTGQKLKQVLDKEIKLLTGSLKYKIIGFNSDGTDFDRFGNETTRYVVQIEIPLFDTEGIKFQGLGGAYMSWIKTNRFD